MKRALKKYGYTTENPNVVFASKIIKCIYLCSFVFMGCFGSDLYPIRVY